MNDLVERFESATKIAAATKRGLTSIPTMDAQALLLMLKEQAEEIERLKQRTAGENEIPMKW